MITKKRHGLVAVRLCDVPLAQRQAAANKLLKYGAVDDDGTDLLLAVLFPSDRVHWVPRASVEAVLSAKVAA